VPALASGVSSASLGRALRHAGVTDATADRAAVVLAELDVAVYSTGRLATTQLAARALAAARAVDAEAVRRTSTRTVAKILLATAFGIATTQGGAMPEPLTRAFDQGVTAYRHGDFGNAERLFARIAARAPRAADAWANYGTAAWARGDTAYAAIGWQRALRLDPLDHEVRDRLDAVQPTAFGDAAYVPPVPIDPVAATALVLWLAAWLLLAMPVRRRPSLAHPAVGGTLTLALLLLGTALELQRQSSVRDLGALRSGRSLLEAPSPGAASVAMASAGEVGAVGAREGAWVRVVLDDERAGWVPVSAVVPLDDPAH